MILSSFYPNTIPDGFALIPDEWVVMPDECVVIPDECVVTLDVTFELKSFPQISQSIANACSMIKRFLTIT